MWRGNKNDLAWYYIRTTNSNFLFSFILKKIQYVYAMHNKTESNNIYIYIYLGNILLLQELCKNITCSTILCHNSPHNELWLLKVCL